MSSLPEGFECATWVSLTRSMCKACLGKCGCVHQPLHKGDACPRRTLGCQSCSRSVGHISSATDQSGGYACAIVGWERWQSGRSHRTRNAACLQGHRGFESPPLRQNLINHNKTYWNRTTLSSVKNNCFHSIISHNHSKNRNITSFNESARRLDVCGVNGGGNHLASRFSMSQVRR